MKNTLFLFAFSLLLYQYGFAQQFYELDTYSRHISATLDLAAGQLENVQFQEAPVLTNDLQKIGHASGNAMMEAIGGTSTLGAPEITDLRLQTEHGELILTFRLPRTLDEQYYMTKLNIRLDDEPITLNPEDLKGDVNRTITSSGDLKRIVWTDLLENNVNLQGELKVTLHAALWGIRRLPYNVICGVVPEFGFKQQLPYYIAAGVGVAAIGAGQIFRAKRDDAYQAYLDAETLPEGQPFYEDSNGRHHTYLILTWTGAAIIGADAVLYFFRRKLHKKRLQVYQEFCSGASLTLQPMMDLPGGNSLLAPDGRAGMRLTLRF